MDGLRKYLLVLLITSLLAACAREGETADPTATPTPPPAATRQTTGAMARPETPTPSPSPTATFTPLPTATPLVPVITALDQVLNEDGELVIAGVTAPEDGWLVIHAQDEEGNVGDVLGTAPVTAGSNTSVAVTVDPFATTPTLVAMLHVDVGTVGTFEFPGADEPLTYGEGAVVALFAVTIEFDLPAIAVTDQDVAEDGIVVVDSVYTADPGWLALHAAADGAPGRLLGYVYLKPGLHEEVPVTIPWREAPPYLQAVLYTDEGEPQRFDYPDADQPVQVNGDIVSQPLHVVYPPDVFVLDQPVVDGEIVVERVVSDGPGWIVVHFDDEGELGLIIGFAPLEDGVNEGIRIPLVETAVTNPMYIMLHQDLDPVGEFDFPQADPQRLNNNRVMDPVPFSTSPGNILYTADQELPPAAGGTVTITVPLVISDLNTWVVIRADAAGELGEIIGRSWLPPGINRDVVVAVEETAVTDTLHAVLHHDADNDEEFDFPDGDAPLLRNQRVIRAPFFVDGNP